MIYRYDTKNIRTWLTQSDFHRWISANTILCLASLTNFQSFLHFFNTIFIPNRYFPNRPQEGSTAQARAVYTGLKSNFGLSPMATLYRAKTPRCHLQPSQRRRGGRFRTAAAATNALKNLSCVPVCFTGKAAENWTAVLTSSYGYDVFFSHPKFSDFSGDVHVIWRGGGCYLTVIDTQISEWKLCQQGLLVVSVCGVMGM